jgi:hypothetical protein
MLQDVSVMELQDPQNYIADIVFPILPVDHRRGKYYLYNEAYFKMAGARKRKPGTESVAIGWGTERADYALDEWAVHVLIPDEDREEADSVFDLDADTTIQLTETMRVSKETEFISHVMGTGIWGTTLTGEVHGGGGGATYFDWWTDTDNSTPIQDIRKARNTIASATGRKPNKLILAPKVFDALVEHPDIVRKFIYKDNTDIILNELNLATVFSVDQVLVPYAMANTAAEGQTFAPDYLYGNDALLLYTAPGPGKRVATGGYNITLRQQAGQPVTVRKMREQEQRADWLEVAASWQFKIVSPPMGVFFSGAVET